MHHTEEIIAITLTFVVHVIGAAALVWAMLDDRGWAALKDWWPRDDWPRPEDDEPRGPAPDDGGGVPADLPLPGAVPSAVRLREPGRIGDQKPRPWRRPEHEPERQPARRDTPA